MVNTVYSRQSSERFLSKKSIVLREKVSIETTQNVFNKIPLTTSNLSTERAKELKIMKSSLSFQPFSILLLLIILFSQSGYIKRIWVKAP